MHSQTLGHKSFLPLSFWWPCLLLLLEPLLVCVQALRENDTLCIEKWLTTVTVISPFRLGIRRLMKMTTYTIYCLSEKEDKGQSYWTANVARQQEWKITRHLLTLEYLITVNVVFTSIFLTNFPLNPAKSKWVIPFICWAFNLLLKVLNCPNQNESIPFTYWAFKLILQ